MSDKFKMNDAFRQRVEIEASAKKSAEVKIVRETENKFRDQLIKTYGNGKIYQESEATLERVDEGSTSAYTFEGKVTVHAKVTDSEGIKCFSAEIPVSKSKINLFEVEDLKKLVSDTEIEAMDDVDVPEFMALKADLGKFKIVDDGSDYLKIYHEALDMGKELGVIHKEEYSNLKNKEASFKEILANQIAHSNIENYNTLEFEGSFVEPTIEALADETILTASDYKKCPNCDKQLDDCECDPSQTKKDPEKSSVEAEEDEDDKLLLAKQPDTYQRSLDFENQTKSSQRNRLLRRIANDVYKHLHNLKYAGIKIGSVDPSELDNENSGSVKIKTFLQDETGFKHVIIPVDVEAGVFKLPKNELISDILSKTDSIEETVEEQLHDDAAAKINEINEFEDWKENETEAALKSEAEIKKEAAHSDGIQMLGPTSVIKMEKHLLGLPEDTEIGTVVYADGHHWKLTDKSDGQLSKEADSGSIWTFTKVETGDKQPEHKLST